MTEKVEEFTRLLQFPEVQEVLKEIVRSSLIESNVFTRLNLIEEHLGADDYHCVGRDLCFEDGISESDEEKIPLTKLPEMIAAIYTAIDSKETVSETMILAGNETEVRARLLKTRVQSSNMLNGKRQMNSKDVQRFLLEEIPEEHRTTKTSARKVAFDVMKKTQELFPEQIKLVKNKKGLNVIEFLENRYQDSVTTP